MPWLVSGSGGLNNSQGGCHTPDEPPSNITAKIISEEKLACTICPSEGWVNYCPLVLFFPIMWTSSPPLRSKCTKRESWKGHIYESNGCIAIPRIQSISWLCPAPLGFLSPARNPEARRRDGWMRNHPVCSITPPAHVLSQGRETTKEDVCCCCRNSRKRERGKEVTTAQEEEGGCHPLCDVGSSWAKHDTPCLLAYKCSIQHPARMDAIVAAGRVGPPSLCPCQNHPGRGGGTGPPPPLLGYYTWLQYLLRYYGTTITTTVSSRHSNTLLLLLQSNPTQSQKEGRKEGRAMGGGRVPRSSRSPCCSQR